jgi:hypothetical protein
MQSFLKYLALQITPQKIVTRVRSGEVGGLPQKAPYQIQHRLKVVITALVNLTAYKEGTCQYPISHTQTLP